MPKLTEHKRGKRILIVGDPGSGKSSAVGSLAEYGQELFICDFDDNLDPLPEFLSPEAIERIHYETLLDKVKMDSVSGKPIVEGIPAAWPKYVELSKSWTDSTTGKSFGAPESWPDNFWFVEDSLTTKGNASMNYTMFKRKRMGKRRGYAEWGEAIERVEGSIDAFRYAGVNYICTAHLARLNMEDVTESADDDGSPIDRPKAAKRLPPNAMMRYPVTLGQKLPPRIGGYFNLVLQAVRIGSGAGARRVLRTVPEEDVDIKVPLPRKKLPVDVPIEKFWEILKHFT